MKPKVGVMVFNSRESPIPASSSFLWPHFMFNSPSAPFLILPPVLIVALLTRVGQYPLSCLLHAVTLNKVQHQDDWPCLHLACVSWKEGDLDMHQPDSRRRAKHAPVRLAGDWKRDVRRTVLIDVIAVVFSGKKHAQKMLYWIKSLKTCSCFVRIECSFQAVTSSHHSSSPREPAPTMSSSDYNARWAL